MQTHHNWPCVLIQQTGRQEEFTDQLARMSQSEAIFLLTTFANIATSRDEKEKELIEAITLEVYKVWNVGLLWTCFINSENCVKQTPY